MAWRRSGDKPLSEPMVIRQLTHIYVIGLHEFILLADVPGNSMPLVSCYLHIALSEIGEEILEIKFNARVNPW